MVATPWTSEKGLSGREFSVAVADLEAYLNLPSIDAYSVTIGHGLHHGQFFIFFLCDFQSSRVLQYLFVVLNVMP
jgi:hypothetical protein